MFKDKKILAIIPARGGSKRLPGKNIKLFAGKPLLSYSIKHAQQSKYVDRYVVSTEEEAIARVAKDYGAEAIIRPKELAEDITPMTPVLKNVLENVGEEFDYLVLLQPTSPLRKSETIDKAIEFLIANESNFDSLLPIKKFGHKIISIVDGICDLKGKNDVRSQDWKPTYFECSTVYVYKTFLAKNNLLNNERILPFLIESDIESIDIDTLEEFQIAESIMKAIE